MSERLIAAFHRRNGVLALALFDAFRADIIRTIILRFTAELCEVFSGFLLKYILTCSIDVYDGNTSQLRPGLLYVGMLFLLQFFGNLITSNTIYLSERFGIKARISLIALIYRKSTTVSARALHGGDFDRGALVALASHHASQIQFSADRFQRICGEIPAGLVALGLLLVNLTPLSIFAGILPMLIWLPILSSTMSQLILRCRSASIVHLTRRSSVMLSVLAGIRYVKYYAWEVLFLERISAIREEEVHEVRKMHFLNMGSFATTNFVGAVMPLLIFAVYSYDHELTVPIVFSSLALIKAIASRASVTHMSVFKIKQTYLSLLRIQAYLSLEDEETDQVTIADHTALCNASFTWDAQQKAGQTPFELKCMSVDFPTSSLTMLVGSVASGKTSLIQALAGEMRKTSGQILMRGKRSHCPQTPWIQNASVRENILFGCPYEADWYQKVVYACALTLDFDLFQDGDATQIGESGTVLSGGQRARVSLARAIYCKPDLILLDDVRVLIALSHTSLLTISSLCLLLMHMYVNIF